MGWKYDRCHGCAPEGEPGGTGKIRVRGREIKCPVCKGNGFLDTRMDSFFEAMPGLREKLDRIVDDVCPDVPKRKVLS